MKYEIDVSQGLRFLFSIRMFEEKIFEYSSTSSRSRGIFCSFALPEPRKSVSQSLLSFDDFNEWLK